MGNYSYFIVSVNGASICKIDWDNCNFAVETEHSECYHITWLKKNLVSLGVDKRPETLEELAKSFDDHKLFGYLDNGYIEAFREVCRHLVMPPTVGKMFPRIYFEEEGFDRIHYLEFHPGTDVVLWGNLRYDMPTLLIEASPEDDDHFEKWQRETHEFMIRLITSTTAEWRVMPLVPYDLSKKSTLELFDWFFRDEPPRWK